MTPWTKCLIHSKGEKKWWKRLDYDDSGDVDADDRNLLFGWRGWRPGSWRRPPRLAAQWSPFPCLRNRDATQICLRGKKSNYQRNEMPALTEGWSCAGNICFNVKISFILGPASQLDRGKNTNLSTSETFAASLPIFSFGFLKVENIGYRILFDPSACRRRAALPSGFSSLGWVSNVNHRFWKLIEILIKSFWILGRAECIMYCRIFLLFICRPRKGEVIILERALFLLDL